MSNMVTVDGTQNMVRLKELVDEIKEKRMSRGEVILDLRDSIGQRHCEDGPALVFSNGPAYHFIHGQRIEHKNIFMKATGMTEEDIAFMFLKHGNHFHGDTK